MPSPSYASKADTVSPSSPKRSLKAAEVLQEMERLHASMEAGDRFPGRQALMQRLNASERAVNSGLDELARQGKLIKRLGRGGSIVAERNHTEGNHAERNHTEGNPAALLNGKVVQTASGIGDFPLITSQSRTVIAITEPDSNIFDQAMQLLMKQAKSANLTAACHLLSRSEAAHFAAPPVAEGVRSYLVFRRENLPLATTCSSKRRLNHQNLKFV